MKKKKKMPEVGDRITHRNEEYKLLNPSTEAKGEWWATSVKNGRSRRLKLSDCRFL